MDVTTERALNLNLCLFPNVGFQYREIVCINRHTEQEAPDRKCDSAAKPVPEEEPCNTHPCPPLWASTQLHENILSYRS